MGLQMTGRLVPATQGGADWLGDEPAIEVDGRRHTPDDRRRVSTRWLSGTVLTGLSGALLISAAAYTALDQQTRFAEAPTRAQTARGADADEQQTVNPKKGDRLMRAVDVVAAKQTFRAATTSRAGDKEVVRNRAFTRVAATLALAPSSFAGEVPPYNPLKLMTDARAPENAADADLAPDLAEVSFETRDLAAVAMTAQSAQLTLDEAQAQVIEQVKSSLAAGAQSAALPLPGQMLLTRTSRAAIDPLALAYATPGGSLTPFSGIEVRMVAENVTVAPRDTPQPTQMEEKLVVVKRGQTLADVLDSVGVPRARANEVAAAFKNKRGEPVREGQRVKLLFADFDGSGKNMQLARMSVYNDETIESVVAATDRGAFMQTPTAPTSLANNGRSKSHNEGEEDEGAMRLYDSLYETALKQQIPRPIINELVRVFANDADLQRGVSGGDTFDIFYDEAEDGASVGRDALLYASLTTRNETYRYYRFFTPDDGLLDY
ncbi:MAG: peptidase M23, partial [Methylocystis sp.]